MENALESARRVGSPAVSVVVVSYNTPQTLEKCLASLCHQPAAEIFVIDCSASDPALSLRSRFPSVEFRHFSRNLTIPELRREGIHASSGEIVALTESWMEPSPGWVKALCEAHRERPDDAVVGGPIAFPRPGEKPTRLEWADYLSEYGEQIPAADSRSQGLSANSSPEKLSGANCSYKRWALDACEDLISEGAWETAIHQRLAGQGFGLSRAPGAYVCYYKPGHWRELIDQRFHYGRDHGAERLREAGWARRLAQVSAAPLVPWLLLGRLWRRAPAGSDIRGQVLAAAGWLLALYGAWALGEAVGAWFAPDREEKHVF